MEFNAKKGLSDQIWKKHLFERKYSIFSRTLTRKFGKVCKLKVP